MIDALNLYGGDIFILMQNDVETLVRCLETASQDLDGIKFVEKFLERRRDLKKILQDNGKYQELLARFDAIMDLLSE